ncbi:hypothetical protein [Roseibium aggregatum]|uniref:DUF4189 domain-containing protein n=1 Tax=Roseibium aggregatum TaxID=187304 RepID=A0A926P481_9HYPH|nr:hypothetical protein [Roseibium aggregatum]MBD1549590.1 hypothetical protein [Roseibium aggregatum]
MRLPHLPRRAVLASIAVITLAACQTAQSAGNPYKSALPALQKAGGGKTCTSCFLNKYAPATFNKAFAVSKDGAYGGRWGKDLSISAAKRAALDSCRKKPNYNPANPCVIFFENDKLVWKP